MRISLIVLCLALTSTSAFADDNYSDRKNHQTRTVPSQQYGSGDSKSADNGKAIKEPSFDYLSSPNHDIDIAMEAGYKTSELRWNIAGNSSGTSPNILSELKWENVGGYQVQPSIEYNQKTGSLKGLVIQASANKTINNTGDNQDSDYNGNNRTLEFSRSNNSADGGDSDGFSAAIGYAFDFSSNRRKNLLRFTTLVGYARQNQKFVMRDGFQTIPGTGAFPNLRSSYDMELSMPFIGAELSGRFYDAHSLKFRLQATKGTYNGTGHWNLRNDFAQPDSFKQEADGYGFLLGGKYGWQFAPHTQFTISTAFNYFKTSKGTDVTNFSNGTTGHTRFNEAEFL